ncbi:GNAT family N-acetyltransferase [Hoeflea sp.]|uniref:GNAT family N-acetyltransferase n=1 Tax=Hoeflea sp. TaxID=1940281 RepID=UPI003B518532
MTDITVTALAAGDLDNQLDRLGAIMAATVSGGAAIGFMQPFDVADGRDFFENAVFPEVRAGRRLLLAAALEGKTAGTVQLITILPPNQPHRCEVAKMMVAPEARRKGVGRALLSAVDTHATAAGKTLITLDTRTGDAAEPLYRAAGYRTAGVIPGFALDADGRGLHATTYMYKAL